MVRTRKSRAAILSNGVCGVASRCEVERRSHEFYKHRSGSAFRECKFCTRSRVKARRLSFGKELVAAYERRRASDPARRLKQRVYRAAWKRRHPERLRALRQRYRRNCRELGVGEFSQKGKRRHTLYTLRRYHADPNFKLAMLLRSRTRLALKGIKAGSSVDDLGCTVKN